MNNDNPSQLDLFEYWKSKPTEELFHAYLNEIKNPIVSIKGWIKLMQKDESEVIRSRALDAISNIIEKIDMDDKLIREILEFKRTSGG
jgi:signal transduction histidine kinase